MTVISPCGVDSLNPSDHVIIVSILHALLLLTTSFSSSRPIPVPASISSIHLFLGRPSSSSPLPTRQYHLLLHPHTPTSAASICLKSGGRGSGLKISNF